MKKMFVTLLFVVVLVTIVGATNSVDVSAKSKKEKCVEKLKEIVEKVKDTVGPVVTKALNKIIKKYEAGKITFKKALKKIKAKIKEFMSTPVSLEDLLIPPIISTEKSPDLTRTLPCPIDQDDGLVPIPLAPDEESVIQLC